jgi:hypothetical protein
MSDDDERSRFRLKHVSSRVEIEDVSNGVGGILGLIEEGLSVKGREVVVEIEGEEIETR